MSVFLKQTSVGFLKKGNYTKPIERSYPLDISRPLSPGGVAIAAAGWRWRPCGGGHALLTDRSGWRGGGAPQQRRWPCPSILLAVPRRIRLPRHRGLLDPASYRRHQRQFDSESSISVICVGIQFLWFLWDAMLCVGMLWLMNRWWCWWINADVEFLWWWDANIDIDELMLINFCDDESWFVVCGIGSGSIPSRCIDLVFFGSCAHQRCRLWNRYLWPWLISVAFRVPVGKTGT